MSLLNATAAARPEAPDWSHQASERRRHVERRRNRRGRGGRREGRRLRRQPGHEDQAFEVHGLTNPTLVVPLGAQVHFNLVNMDYGDGMEHGVILTPPPYPYMSMIATGPGLAAIVPLLSWRRDNTVTEVQYASLGISFVARDAGAAPASARLAHPGYLG